MEIVTFSLSTDKTKLNLVLSDAATATTLKVWTDATYKDYSEAIDLSTLLNNAASQSIEITPTDLNIPYLDGIYFVEVEDPAIVLNQVAANLTRYKECILNKLREVSVCLDCPGDKTSLALINLQGILYGLEIAIDQGFIDEITLKFNAIKKYCSDDCKSCGDKSNIIDTNYYSTND